jgi:hypothetical protein
MKYAIHLWLSFMLLLTLPFWMACSKTTATAPMIDCITHYDSLLLHEGDTVQIQGTFFKYNGMPQFGAQNANYIPSIFLADDSTPRLFIHGEMEPGRMDSLDGKQVTMQGVFYTEEQLLSGDPPWASRRTGSWLYEVSDLQVVGNG